MKIEIEDEGSVVKAAWGLAKSTNMREYNAAPKLIKNTITRNPSAFIALMQGTALELVRERQDKLRADMDKTIEAIANLEAGV